MNKYEEALNEIKELKIRFIQRKTFQGGDEIVNFIPNKIIDVFQEAVKKAHALDTALNLIKEKRNNAEMDLKTSEGGMKLFIEHYHENMKYKEYELNNMEKEIVALKNQYAAYTDCIITIEAELGRTER